MVPLVAVLAVAGCRAGEPRVERTTGKNGEATRAFLDRHFTAVRRDGQNVRFVGDDWFGVGASRARTGEFVVPVGGTFQGRRDHHASSRYRVDAVDDAGVTVWYESSFNHSSFGKNLITVDSGTVKLPWRD